MDKKRTTQQNKSLHLMFEMLAQELNSAGLDMKRTLKPEIDIPWNATSIKQFLWKPVQKAQLKKEHTSDLTTKEIDKVFDTLCKHLGERFGIGLVFPSIETLIDYDYKNL